MRVVVALMRASLLAGMQYRSEFLLDLVTGILRTFWTMAPLWLVFAHRESVAGWTLPEASLVVALFLGLAAFQGGVVEPNLGEVVESVRNGTLDLVLVKPADAQLLVSVRKIAVSRVWDLVGGVALGAWALARLPTPAAGDVAVAATLAGAGLVAMYGIWLLAICAAFFFVKVDNLRYLLWAVNDAGRWPLDVFRGAARALLTFVVPVGLITSFPAMALRGEWSGWLVATSIGTASAFAVISRWAWRRSLAAYTSASG
jgi:ABC-2 type transport system permease protein